MMPDARSGSDMNPQITILDGAMGTELRARGATVPDYRSSAWSAMALIHDPDTVRQVHSDYVAAGADVITANNYAVVPNLLARVGMAGRLEELTRLACRLAREARSANQRPGVRVAGSLAPLDTTYDATLVMPERELYENYLRIARVLVSEVDLIMAETLTTVREAVAAARAAAEVGLPIWVSWNLQLESPTIRGGESLRSGIAALEALPVSGYLVNCVPTSVVQPALELMRAGTDRPLGAYANSCEHASDQASLDTLAAHALTPQQYVAASERWVAAGATMIGGCCDTRPDYIAALARRWK
jgi:S-methylmethionine-dependent homocysteine/selenocysteine methylase